MTNICDKGLKLKIVDKILKRGFVKGNEWDVIEESIGFDSFWSEDREEKFWGIKLDEEKFVLANHPIAFWGGPNTIGLVAIHKDNIMETKPSIDLFIKTNRPIKKTK